MSVPAPLHRMTSWSRWAGQWAKLERDIGVAGQKLDEVSQPLAGADTLEVDSSGVSSSGVSSRGVNLRVAGSALRLLP